jgi:hypothetical protein
MTTAFCRHCLAPAPAAEGEACTSVRCSSCAGAAIAHDRFLKMARWRVPKNAALRVYEGRLPPLRWPTRLPWLGLMGPRGTGKTTKAVRFLEGRGGGLFVDYRGFIDARREAVQRSQPDPIWALQEAQVLLIDDLCPSGKRSDFVLETTEALLRPRYNGLRPLIFTVNVEDGTANPVEVWYGQTVASRVSELAMVESMTERVRRKGTVPVEEPAAPTDRLQEAITATLKAEEASGLLGDIPVKERPLYLTQRETWSRAEALEWALGRGYDPAKDPNVLAELERRKTGRTSE